MIAKHAMKRLVKIRLIGYYFNCKVCSDLVGIMFPITTIGKGYNYPFNDAQDFMKLTAEPFNELSTFASNLNIVNFNDDGNACRNNYIFQ